MRVAIIGSGYVGLVSGACFADIGAHVCCVDINAQRVATLNSGGMPIYEPGLEALVARNKAQGRLSFSTNLAAAVTVADLVFIAVDTPAREGDGYADMRSVHKAAEQIAPHLSGYTVIVNKSTVPVGTARQVARIISETNPEASFDVASNPEFLREGVAIKDFMQPDRVVLGVESDIAETLLRDLYRPVTARGHDLLITRIESAELIKYASNAFLATKISFVNEMANLCEAIGADISEVSKGMGMDARIGPHFLQSGPGYGGSCFPKDTMALVRIGQEHGAPSRIVESVVEVNAAQKARMVQKIRRALGGFEAGKTVAVLGLSFKPGTDDLRSSPALTIISNLVSGGARVRAHDPKAMQKAGSLLPSQVEFCQSAYQAAENADLVVLVTEWEEYGSIDFTRLHLLMRGSQVLDLRNYFEPEAVARAGLRLIGIGRGAPRNGGEAQGHSLHVVELPPQKRRASTIHQAENRTAHLVALKRSESSN